MAETKDVLIRVMSSNEAAVEAAVTLLRERCDDIGMKLEFQTPEHVVADSYNAILRARVVVEAAPPRPKARSRPYWCRPHLVHDMSAKGLGALALERAREAAVRRLEERTAR